MTILWLIIILQVITRGRFVCNQLAICRLLKCSPETSQSEDVKTTHAATSRYTCYWLTIICKRMSRGHVRSHVVPRVALFPRPADHWPVSSSASLSSSSSGKMLPRYRHNSTANVGTLTHRPAVRSAWRQRRVSLECLLVVTPFS